MSKAHEGGSFGARVDAWGPFSRGVRGNDRVNKDKGFFDDQEKTILIILLAGLILIGLVMGSSCNLHIEIKQTPAKTEKKE